MDANDKKRFSAALFGTFEVYEKHCTETMVKIWWAALKQYSIDEVCTALTAHIVDPDVGHFLPKPADVVRNISGTKADISLLAWSRVFSAISIGAGRSVCFDDPVINQTISDIGGWIALCRTDVDKLHFKAKEFELRYKQYINNPPLNPPTHLIGVEEKSNSQFGFESDEPIMIGDKQQARLNYSKNPEIENRVLSFVRGGKV